MLVNPHLIKVESGGGGGSADYIADSLFFLDKRDQTVAGLRAEYLYPEHFDLDTGKATIEVCCNLLNTSDENGYIVLTNNSQGAPPFSLQVALGASNVGTNSDYGVNIAAPMDLYSTFKPDNLKFGETNTFSFTFSAPSDYSTGTCNAYLNGVYVTNYTYEPYIDSNSDGIDLFEYWDGEHKARGQVYSFRIYNKVLSQAEITQNYNADVENFG